MSQMHIKDGDTWRALTAADLSGSGSGTAGVPTEEQKQAFRTLYGLAELPDGAVSGLGLNADGELVGSSGVVLDVGAIDVPLQDYSALRGYTGQRGRVYITGPLVTVQPAGISGIFLLDTADTASADNGGTIIVGADGRRWKRQFSGAANVKWFGARGDGSVLENPFFTAALQAEYSVFAPDGTYILKELATPSKRMLSGNGVGTLFKHPDGDLGTGASAVIRVSNAEDITFKDFAIDGNKSGIIGGDLNNCEGLSVKYGKNVRVSNLLVYNTKSEAVDFDYSEDCSISYLTAVDCGGMAVHLSENSRRCHTYHSNAIRCGIESQRPAFDTWGTSRNCGIIGCTAIDCFRGFNCSGSFNTVDGFKAINCKEWGFWTSGSDNIVTGVVVDGAGIDTSLTGQKGGAITSGARIQVRDLVVSGVVSGNSFQTSATDSAFSELSLDGSTGNTISNTTGGTGNIYQSITVRGGPTGFSSSAPNTTLIGGKFTGTTGDAVNVSGQYFTCSDVHTLSAGGDSFEISGADSSLSRCRAFSSAQAGFRINGNSAFVTDCDSYGHGTSAITGTGTGLNVSGGTLANIVPTLTIAAGVVTLSRADRQFRVYMDTEASAATDDLDTITAGADGQVLVISAASNSRDVVVKHGTGNIKLSGLADFTLDALGDTITLVYRASLSSWCEVSRSNNGA